MAQVEIVTEDDGAAGWAYAVQVLDDDGTLRRHRVTLSWADYNLWSGSGADTPSDVVAAVIQFLLTRSSPDDLRPVFDAAIARHHHPDADAYIPSFISNVR